MTETETPEQENARLRSKLEQIGGMLYEVHNGMLASKSAMDACVLADIRLSMVLGTVERALGHHIEPPVSHYKPQQSRAPLMTVSALPWTSNEIFWFTIGVGIVAIPMISWFAS